MVRERMQGYISSKGNIYIQKYAVMLALEIARA
jgi:hypothetical protein